MPLSSRKPTVNGRREQRIKPVVTGWRQFPLKLNDEKTEVILFTSKHGLKSLPNIAVSVGGQQQLRSSSVRNLGVIYDQHISMTQHVNSVCRIGYYHLRNIGRIRRYLSHDSAKTLVHALVTSRLDYCNFLLHGHARESACENAMSAECMRVHDHKKQSPLAHHSRSEGATLTGFLFTAEYNIRSCHKLSVLSTTKHRFTGVVRLPYTDLHVHYNLNLPSH